MVPTFMAVKHIIVGAKDFGFGYRGSQIRRNVANTLPLVQHFSGAVLLSRGDGSRHSLLGVISRV